MALTDQQKTEAVTAFTDAFNRGDFEAATGIAHPEIEFARSWESKPLRGPEALREWMKPDAFEDQHSDVLDLTVAGDKVLVQQNFRARGAASGIDVDMESWIVVTFDDLGRVTLMQAFLHHEAARAREAAGLGKRA